MSVSNIWVADAQALVYSKAKAMLISQLKKKYPNLYVTDDNETPSEPQFPSVYIHFLQPSERGQDLEGKSINAIYLTAEVDVTATKAQGTSVAKEVAYKTMDIFKSMSFGGRLPFEDNRGDGTKRMVARYSRTIGYNDTI